MDQLPAFRNHLPVKIRFGEGVLANLPEVLASEGCSQPFVVVDELVQSLPAVASALHWPGAVTIHPKSAGEPTVEDVEDAAARLAESGADSIVAIGGGSGRDPAPGGP